MPCLTHSLARAMFAKMAQIKPEDVPQDHALWDDAMWELLSLVAERIADDFYYTELQEQTIRDPQEFENTTCKFAELISRLKLECSSFQKVPQEKRNKISQNSEYDNTTQSAKEAVSSDTEVTVNRAKQ